MIHLSVQNVTFSYYMKYQTVHALRGVNCTLEPGMLYALIGKSGSGKTTLLSLLAGLEKPESGNILVNGKNLQDMDIDLYRRKQASVIYQNYNLFPLMTVQENIMYPLLLNEQTKEQAISQARQTLERVGLGVSYWKRLPAMLSGGEQQRVAIARALAVNAEVILADEPTGNLDTENAKQIVELLRRLAHEEQCCVVLVTHDINVAEVADVVYRIENGRLTEESK